MAVELGELELAVGAIDRSFEAARKIVGNLLGPSQPMSPGSLMRSSEPRAPER